MNSMNMKTLLILSTLFVSYISFTQDYKQKNEFKTKIDSCYLNNVRFSNSQGFFIKIDSLKYNYQKKSDYIWAINEEYHLGASFQIDSVAIEIKRIKENYWYYTEKLDSTYLLKVFFSIDNSTYEIPVGNYEFEVYKEPFDIENETRYFDSLHPILRQGDWREIHDEFDNIEYYKNNKKEGKLTLYNTKYSYILLSSKTYKKNTLLKESILIKYQIKTDNYFLESWKVRNNFHTEIPYLLFKKKTRFEANILFDKNYYHYYRRCGNSPKSIDYKWKYNKKQSTLLLDSTLYKVIDSSEDQFTLVKIEE